MSRMAWFLAKTMVNEWERSSKKRAIKKINAEFARKALYKELAFFNRVERTGKEIKAYRLLEHESEYKSTFELEADSRRLKHKAKKGSITPEESIRLKCLTEMIIYRTHYRFAPFEGKYPSPLTSVDARFFEEVQSSVLFLVLAIVVILLFASDVFCGYIFSVIVFGLITLSIFESSKSTKAKSDEIKLQDKNPGFTTAPNLDKDGKSFSTENNEYQSIGTIQKVPCMKCMVLILPGTAKKTGGKCMPCFNGTRKVDSL